MSRLIRTIIAISSLLAAIAIGLADAVVGFSPDVTILYLVPIVAATVYVSLAYGLFVAVTAALAELIFHFRFGAASGISLSLDVTLHFLVFTLTALLIGRLIVQLRVIREFEEKRSYDLEIAQRIHASVFTLFPDRHKDLSIAHKLVFARELGGDYYHIGSVGDRLFFCIADISGKSVSAALFSAMLHQNIIEALEHTDDLTELVKRVNTHIYSTLSESMFITLFCCLFGDESIDFVNAGHETPLLYSSQTDTIKRLVSKEVLPIGIEPELIIETQSAPFLMGDMFLAFTDGVTDSENFRDMPYERLEDVLYANTHSGPHDIVKIIYQKTVSESKKMPFDDIIIAAIKREGL
ncbi:MAG: SpoIIE family protein phosphatase [Actinomycetota bacterium]|nr:SpoIIE family protein phosphatase [Actinomycetota bacterium]